MKKYLNIITLAVAITGLSSCLKDDKANLTPDNSPAVVEFSSSTTELAVSPSGANYALYERAYDTGTSEDATFIVNYTGGAVAPRDIKVTFGVKAGAVQAYVDERKNKDRITLVGYEDMPANYYTLPTDAVIPKGERKVTIHVKVNTTLITDFSKSYILPLSITGADGATVSGNYGTILVKINRKNIYDGVYSDKGFIFRTPDPDGLGGNFKGQSIPLATKSANSLAFTPLWNNGTTVGGISNVTINVDPATNKVTMTADQAALKNVAGYDNRYDPATKTFYLSFTWSSTRAHTDTLTYTGPR